MGCLNSKEKDIERERSNEIDKRIKSESLEKEIRVLLLGTGDSGKSTIIKQFKLIYGDKFNEEDKNHYKKVIHINLIDFTYTIINDKLHSLELENNLHYKYLSNNKNLIRYENIPEDFFESIKILWKNIIRKINKDEISNHILYYIDNIDRICNTYYSPNDKDILNTRIRTTGIIEEKINIKNTKYNIIDVGGQRSERRKWIHCFENVNFLIFLISISEYDQFLEEDEKVNRLEESLEVFNTYICKSIWFKKTPIILFFNKTDLFEKKLEKKPLKEYYKDYEGNFVEDAYNYIKNKFLNLYDSDKDIYIHFTQAIDTENMRIIIDNINDNIIKNNLKVSGLL